MQHIQFEATAWPALGVTAVRTFGFIQGGYSNLDALTGSAGLAGTLCGSFTARVAGERDIGPADVIAFTLQLTAGTSTLCGGTRLTALRYVPGVDASLAFVARFSVGCWIRVGPGALCSPAGVTGWLGRLGGWTAAPVRTMELENVPCPLAAEAMPNAWHARSIEAARAVTPLSRRRRASTDRARPAMPE